jgi:hypothetical protein
MTSSNSTLPSIPPDVATITGPRIVGYLFNWGLFGILSVQVYLFHLAFPNDPLRNKVLVYAVFVLEILQTIIITRSAFHVFGDGYGNFSFFNDVELAWLDVPVITGIVAFVAEGFYAYRISVLAQSYWVAGVIMFFALLQLGGAIAAAVVLKNAILFSDLLGREYSIAAGIWNGGSALCDVIIAVCMTYYLSRRGSGAMQKTRMGLRRVIRLVIETGTTTAAIAILNLVLLNLPGTSYYLVPSEILAKVYSNSMMVVLNSRMKIGIDVSSEGTTSVQRMRTDPSMHRGTDAYELSEGVVITREEVVFPSGNEASKVVTYSQDKPSYFV